MQQKFLKTKKSFIVFLSILLPMLLNANPYKSSIINLSFNGTDTVIFIIKDQSLINVVEIAPDTIREISTFQLLDLQNLDNKNFNNDEGTPEGIYFINELITIKDYDNPAVPTAAVLNYPNPVDIHNKRTGNDVWLQNKTANTTNNKSCFYLKNNNLEDLIKYIRINYTPILILKSLKENNPNEVKSYWINFLEKWQQSFASKLLVSHFSLYITDTDDIDFQYAKRINQIIYEKKSDFNLSIDNVIILSTPDESIASFLFNFQSEDYTIEKPFSLSLLPMENEWKIVSENSNYKPVPIKRTENIIKEKIYTLIKAWENKDFRTYISFFDDSFTDGKRNYSQYYNYKRRSFRSLKDVRVVIDNLNIQQLDKNRWLATFRQDYWTDNYQDYGQKEIIFQRVGDDYLIIKEHWSELQKD